MTYLQLPTCPGSQKKDKASREESLNDSQSEHNMYFRSFTVLVAKRKKVENKRVK